MFREDNNLMSEKDADYDDPKVTWAYIKISGLDVDIQVLPYDNNVTLDLN